MDVKVLTATVKLKDTTTHEVSRDFLEVFLTGRVKDIDCSVTGSFARKTARIGSDLNMVISHRNQTDKLALGREIKEELSKTPHVSHIENLGRLIRFVHSVKMSSIKVDVMIADDVTQTKALDETIRVFSCDDEWRGLMMMFRCWLDIPGDEYWHARRPPPVIVELGVVEVAKQFGSPSKFLHEWRHRRALARGPLVGRFPLIGTSTAQMFLSVLEYWHEEITLWTMCWCNRIVIGDDLFQLDQFMQQSLMCFWREVSGYNDFPQQLTSPKPVRGGKSKHDKLLHSLRRSVLLHNWVILVQRSYY